MNTKTILMAAIAGMLFFDQVALSAQYTSTVYQVQAPNFNRDCLYFTLSGITQADPINPNSPWFAVPRTQIGYSELYAMLLAAKLSGASISAGTTGAVAGGVCGAYAGLAWIQLE
jgi:hypothetical protein